MSRQPPDDDALEDRIIYWSAVRDTARQVSKPLMIGFGVALAATLLTGGASLLGWIAFGGLVATAAGTGVTAFCAGGHHVRRDKTELAEREEARAAERAANAPLNFTDLAEHFRQGAARGVTALRLRLTHKAAGAPPRP